MWITTRYVSSTRDASSNISNLRMHLWWSLCTLYLFACQVRVTVGDSGLCCCVYVFQGLINSLVCWSNQVKCHNSVFLTLVKVSRILVSNTEQNGMALAVLHGQISVWVQKCSSHFIYQSKISSASCKNPSFLFSLKASLHYTILMCCLHGLSV